VTNLPRGCDLTLLCLLALPQTALSQQKPGATQFLVAPEGRIAFDDTGGSGRLVVAVPGMGDMRAEYRYLTPSLTAAGARVVTMDVRGFGQTSAAWPDYSAHAVSRDVVALIRHLGAGPAIVAGTSFAAGSALWAAHDAPALVCGVVLISPIVQDRKQSFVSRAMLALAFASPWRVSFWSAYWNSLFTLHPPPDQAATRAALAANMSEPGRMTALHAMLTLSKADTAEIIDQVHTPALVIVGTADPDFDDPAAAGRALAKQLGGAVVVVPGAGHYPQVESPEIVGPAVAAFVRQHP